MQIKMQKELLKDHHEMQKTISDHHLKNQAPSSNKQHLNMFWGGNDSRPVWEEWLREKGLLPRGNDDESGPQSSNGWSNPIDNDDISEMEDDAWIAGGMKRTGDSEGFSSEEAMGDDWDTNDEDDDEHGGEMMPLPNMI